MGKENIGGVAETMLQTLYACAKESQKTNHKIYDGKAIEIVEGLSMYLSADDVRRILSIINHRFSHATVFMEILNPAFIKKNVEKSISQSGAVFTWGAKNGEDVVCMTHKQKTNCVCIFRSVYRHSDGMRKAGRSSELPTGFLACLRAAGLDWCVRYFFS